MVIKVPRGTLRLARAMVDRPSARVIALQHHRSVWARTLRLRSMLDGSLVTPDGTKVGWVGRKVQCIKVPFDPRG